MIRHFVDRYRYAARHRSGTSTEAAIATSTRRSDYGLAA